MTLRRAALLLSVACLLNTGCKSAPDELGPLETGSKPPSWVLTPERDGYYSAVGICGRTLFRKDAIDRAAEDARANLALAVQAHIKVLIFQFTTNQGTLVEQTQAVEASTLSTELVLENSEIQGLWLDRHGAVDAAEMTYAIARIPKSAVNLKR